MAKFKYTFDGLETYLGLLKEVGDTNRFVKRAVYDGAGVVGEAIIEQVMNLPEGKGGVISAVQKQGLIAGFGYTTMKTENGKTYTKLGFGGYNDLGQPNPLIANIVNSGTSHSPHQKTSFVDKAIRASKDRAYQAMGKRLDEDIEQVMKG